MRNWRLKLNDSDNTWTPALVERNPGDGPLAAGEVQEGSDGRVLVRITSVRRRLLDEDNLCEKYVVDLCRYAGMLPGDEPGQTKIEVGQRKVGKGEDEHVLVEIFSPEGAEIGGKVVFV